MNSVPLGELRHAIRRLRKDAGFSLALGATRSRLALGLAVEAAALCALGAVLAVPVALWLFFGVRAFQLPGNIAVERLELALARDGGH